MSGSNPPPGAADPSMDDILASIRKILNEDEQSGDATLVTPAAAAPPAAIQLTPDMMIAPPEAAAEAPSAAPVVEPPPPPVAQIPESWPEEIPAMTASVPESSEKPGLVDPAAAAAAAASLGALSRAVAMERATQVTRGGISIEDVVREEVRPLLKAWLDEHLPATVERMVRAEIERVMSRQG